MALEHLVLREAGAADLSEIAENLQRIRTAIRVFDLPVQKTWQDRMESALNIIRSLNYFDPANELDFQYLASGFQGVSEDSYLADARRLNALGLAKPAAVINAYCALARYTDIDPSVFECSQDEDQEPEGIGDKLREQLNTLKEEWIGATGGVQPQTILDYLTHEVPVLFQSEREFNAYWVEQICASPRFKALPDKPLLSHAANQWRTHKDAAETLKKHNIEISYLIWFERADDRRATTWVAASNRGLLRIVNNRRANVHHLESWPDGKLIIDLPPEKKLETNGPLDVQARIKYNGITRRLSEAHKTAPKWPLGEMRFVLANFQDVMQREYLSATLGVSNKTLFAPLWNVVMWCAVVAISVWYGDLSGDVERFVNGERSWHLLLALTAKAVFLPWALVEIYWRTHHFLALLRGTIVRGRGRAPMHDSFRGKSLPQSNILLQLMGKRFGN